MWAEKSLADLDSSKMLANEQRQYLMLFMWNTAVICSANHLVNESYTRRNHNTPQTRSVKGSTSNRFDRSTEGQYDECQWKVKRSRLKNNNSPY